MESQTDAPLAWDQLRYLGYEIRLIVNRRWWRWLTCWFGGSTGVILSYRLDRFGFLLFGRAWAFLRIFALPVFLFLRLLGANHEIHYTANIGQGMKILHPVLGIVVSGYAVIGKNLTLTGGNCIGMRVGYPDLELVLGDDVEMGANAVILGPVHVGNRVKVGAGAVVIDSAPDESILGGVPAKMIHHLDTSE